MRHTHRRWHLPPLQNYVLCDSPVGVHINTFIFVTHQKLHSICVGEDDDRVGFDATLNLKKGNKVQESTFVAISSPSKLLSKPVFSSSYY